MKNYVVTSLETHLFFARIMKEHSLFLLASFPAKEVNFKREADWYREQFERILATVVRLANGNVREEVLSSGEVVTEFTQKAERQTRKLTGILIDIQITQAEERLQAGSMEKPNREMVQSVRKVNQRILHLLDGLISLKERILKGVLSCELYTTNYPLLIEHILREAKLYRQTIKDIENGCMQDKNSRTTQMFWNQIMMEHAEFIRGLLDPTECELIHTADDFARDYCELLEMAQKQDCKVREEVTRKTQELTEKYRDFKMAGTDGITKCKIRSIILPLLADHVLREANHYLRLLGNMDEIEPTCRKCDCE